MKHIVRTGYLNGVSHSLKGSIFGLILFLGSFWLLSWNEHDSLKQTQAITEIDQVAIENVSPDYVDPANDGKLVHIAGRAVSLDILVYTKFSINENATHLHWDTSIYQWTENRSNSDGQTSYEYHKRWEDRVVNSSSFFFRQYKNDGSVKHFFDGKHSAKNVELNSFTLNSHLISQIDAKKQYPLQEANLKNIELDGSILNGVFYTGDPKNPQIGDEKVSVYIVEPEQNVALMAVQSGSSFTPYITKNNIKKQILYVGNLSKSDIIHKQRNEAALKRWLFRGFGLILMWMGLALVFSPLRALVSFIPLASRLLEGVTTFVTFFIALGLSLITITIAWIAVRPVLSVFFIIGACASLVVAFVSKDKSTNNKVPEGATSVD